MIVELAGAPGAGKTTLAMHLAAELYDVRLSAVLSPGSSFAQTMLNLLEVPGAALRTISSTEARSCLSAATRSIAARSTFPWRYSRIGSAMRRLASHTRNTGDLSTVHLVDEGVLGILDLAFSGGLPPSTGELDGLTSKIPVSDVVVFLHGSVDLLVRRAGERRDGPHEWRTLSTSMIEGRIERLQEILGITTHTERFRHAMSIESPVSEFDLSAAAARVKVEIARCRAAFAPGVEA